MSKNKMRFFDCTICYRSKFFRRLSNDRGVAMLYTAVITMFILALFSLIHDVGRISEDKIRMQNAADAAALEFATWQARGMNTVQNLNQEIYNLDTFVINMYYTAAVMTWSGKFLEAALGLGAIFEGVGAGLFDGGAYIHHVIGVGMLQSLRHFYAFGTNILACMSASEAASLNGADSIPCNLPNTLENSTAGVIASMTSSMLNSGMRTIHALCVPSSFDTMFMLPLISEKGVNHPLNIRFSATDISKNLIDSISSSFESQLPTNKEENGDSLAPDLSENEEIQEVFSNLVGNIADTLLDAITNTILKAIMEPTIKLNPFTCFLSWDFFTWQDNYYRSIDKYNVAGHTSLPPVLAVVHKKQNPGLISRYLLQAESPLPVMAYAVARCEGGNVDAYFTGQNSVRRKEAHGVSASAVLVPFSKISEVWAENGALSTNSELMELMNGVFLH